MGSLEGLKAASKVYRELMKAVRKHIGKEDHKSHFTDFIKQEFRNSSGQNCSKDPSFFKEKLKLARDYAFYLNSVHHQMELLFCYNIAVDRSEEMKKVLAKSAASVGLQIPDAYQP